MGMVVVIVICTLPLINIFSTSMAAENPLMIGGHVQPAIWSYENIKNQPQTAQVVTLDQQEWQASSAACIVPAFIDRKHATPIIFDDGTEERDIGFPYNILDITDFGADISSASSAIATTYWSKAEVVMVTDTYEHILWASPIASFISAPILVGPSGGTLQTLNTKCAITIGDAIGEQNLDVEQRINLKDIEDVWKFQMDLFDMKGQRCNYIIVTNPNDITEDPNIKWNYLSLASATLSAFRHAAVLTGDYTGNRTLIDALGGAVKQDDELYNGVKPYFSKIKNDTHHVEKFLSDHGHTPEFMALVGGSYEIPDYFYNLQMQYLYWGASDQYPASLSPYANFSLEINETGYNYEDLGIGRVFGHSLIDTTMLLMRTFFYREFLPGGGYESYAPAGWESKAISLDGHRLNQPEPGGPTNLSAYEPYVPAGEIAEVFSNSGYGENCYYTPRNITSLDDTNLTMDNLLDLAANYSLFLLNQHGGSTANKIEIGIDTETGKNYNFFIDAEEVMKRKFAPSIVYNIACDSGTTNRDFDMMDYLALGYLHAGALAYLAPDAFQPLCYWEHAPYGPGVEKSIYFFEKLVSQNIPIGTALREAKWESYTGWLNHSRADDDIDGIIFILYGDPAFEPFKPLVGFSNKKLFDPIADYNGELEASGNFEVSISVSDFESGNNVDNAAITSSFDGKTQTGNKATFSAPDDKGSYQITVTMSKEGYEECTAKYWVSVPTGQGDLLIPMAVVSGVIIIVAAITIFRYKNKPKSEGNETDNSKTEDENMEGEANEE
jgi:hypothetical protein